MSLCQLNQQAVKIFKADGTPITTPADVTEQEILYVSSGEAFVTAPPKSRKTQRVASPRKSDTSPTKSGTSPTKSGISPRKSETSLKKLSSTLDPSKTTKTKQERFKEEVLCFQRLIALSPRTAEESMKESTASVFASLDAAQRAQLPFVLPVHNACQHELLLRHLLRLRLAPRDAVILPSVTKYAEEAFVGLSTSEVKFVVGGPTQSGKTSLLYLLTSVLCRKLQLSDEASSFLFFPINGILSAFDLSEGPRLLRLFMRTAFESAEYSVLRLLPYLESLRKWFFVSVFGSSIAIPQELANSGFVDSVALQTLTHDLKRALQQDNESSLTDFVRTVCSFPSNFARAIGLSGTIFIIDGFDACNTVIEPKPGAFARSFSSARVSDFISAELVKSPFVVSMHNPQTFFESFVVPDAMWLGTEGLVEPEGQEFLCVHSPVSGTDDKISIKMKESECGGYPGFVVKFREIVAKAKMSQELEESKYSGVITAAAISRQLLLKHEALHLIELLADAEVGGINQEVLGRFETVQDLVVRIELPQVKGRKKKEPTLKSQSSLRRGLRL
jgi:hypothetical protein